MLNGNSMGTMDGRSGLSLAPLSLIAGFTHAPRCVLAFGRAAYHAAIMVSRPLTRGKRTVNAHMLCAGNDHEIVDRVMCFVFIVVVNNLSRSEFAPQVLLHQQSMLPHLRPVFLSDEYVATRESYPAMPVGIVFPASRLARASPRAILPFTRFHLREASKEFIAALFTCSGNARLAHASDLLCRWCAPKVLVAPEGHSCVCPHSIKKR